MPVITVNFVLCNYKNQRMQLATWIWGQDVGRNMVVSCRIMSNTCISHASAMQPCISTEAHLQTGAKEALVEGICRAIGSKGQLQAGQPGATEWNGVASVASVASPTGDATNWRQLTIASHSQQFDWLGKIWKKYFICDAIPFLKNGTVLVCCCGVIRIGSEATVYCIQCVPIPGWTCRL